MPLWFMRKDSISLKVLDGLGTAVTKKEFIPNQTHEVIGTNSILDLVFDIDSLSKNINFLGSISLEARSGDRKIEIDPYYTIGESQNAYGVDSRPIKEIADYFMRLVVTADNVDQNLDRYLQLHGVLVDHRQVDEVKRRIRIAISWLNGRTGTLKGDDLDLIADVVEVLSDRHKSKIVLQNLGYNTAVNDASSALNLALTQTNFGTISHGQVIQSFYYRNTQQDTAWLSTQANVKRLSIQYEELIREIIMLHKLLIAIARSDDKTIKAFLNFTYLTITDFKALTRELDSHVAIIKDYTRFDSYVNSEKMSEIDYKFSSIRYLISMFINSGGTVLNLGALVKPEDFRSENERSMKNLFLEDDNTPKESLNLGNKKAYEFLRNLLAAEAGKTIFSNLIRGRIDVARAKIQDGEDLEIFMVWRNTAKNDTTSQYISTNALRLPLAKFSVRKIGWHLELAESALLIHRIDEEKLGSDYPISPSNFKPTAGASMLWTYHNTFRIKEEAKLKGLIKTIKWLEPSFGINVAYLDFRTDRDVEFGAGPVIGVFRNRMFFNAGYNFSVNGESPFYMGIGFSFLNIFQRIKDNEGK